MDNRGDKSKGLARECEDIVNLRWNRNLFQRIGSRQRKSRQRKSSHADVCLHIVSVSSTEQEERKNLEQGTHNVPGQRWGKREMKEHSSSPGHHPLIHALSIHTSSRSSFTGHLSQNALSPRRLVLEETPLAFETKHSASSSWRGKEGHPHAQDNESSRWPALAH